jgi:serine phosphatase RsbU (regulator of sigma subunit)
MNKLKQWFIGDYLAKTPDVFGKAKIELLYNFSIWYLILGGLFYVGLIIKGLHYHVAIVSLAVMGLITLPFVLKYTQNLRIAAILLITEQFIVSAVSIFIEQGKQDMAGGLWFAVFVAIALFLFERKWGIILIIFMAFIGGLAGALSQKVDIPKGEKMWGTPDEFLTPFMLLIVIIWQFLKARSEAEDHIRKQRLQLEINSRELEVKNKDVTDSINYAKRIQYAVLPQEETIYRSIPLSFIFYKPKDIVSGDFFWFHEISRDEYILVCADCTGHGVPGAFMTVIGSNLLNQTVIDNKIYDPGRILSELDSQINFTLKQQKDHSISVQDGMDLTLLKVNKAKKEFVITSAKRPVIFVRDKEVREIKASKFSLGGMRSGDKIFSEFKMNYQEDDILYLYTDGYTDQFGGEKSKKFSSKRLRELFSEISKLPIGEQKNKLAHTINEWKGNLEQIDDMLVMGIKL